MLILICIVCALNQISPEQLIMCLFLDTSDREVQDREVIVGIVTDIDLLHYIARHETGSGSGGAGSGSSGECSPRNKSSSEASN